MKPETYEWAFREAGFTHFEWRPMNLRENIKNNNNNNSENDNKDNNNEKNIESDKYLRDWFSDILLHPFDIGIVAY